MTSNHISSRIINYPFIKGGKEREKYTYKNAHDSQLGLKSFPEDNVLLF